MKKSEPTTKGPDSRKQKAPSTWHLGRTSTEAAKGLVEWNDEGIACNWSKAARAYLYASAFEGYSITSLGAFGCDVQCESLTVGEEVPIYVNRVRSMGQTFVAKTGANDDPVPQFVTNGGTFEEQQAAETMDRVICAEYDAQHGGYTDFHALCRKLELMVATALGRGWVFVFPGVYGGKAKPEAEIDDGLTINVVREHQYGRILRLSRSTWRDPEALIAKYPRKRAAILENVEVVQANLDSGWAKNSAFPSLNSSVQPTQRLVRVVQGWHISTGKKDPGRELHTLKDGTWLEDNEWTRSTPPCRHIDYDEELSGAGGVPLTHAIYRLFVREQELIDTCDRLETTTPLEVFLTRRSNGDGPSVKKQLEGAAAIEVVEVDDPANALVPVDMNGLPRKTVELMDRYADSQHEVLGISRGHADAVQQKNVNSGIQASLDASLFPERHADFVLRFNRFRAVDCAELFVWAIQDIVDSGELYSIWAGDEEIRKLVKGDDLDLDLEKYRLQVKPSSARKDSVATRLQKAEKWLQDPSVQFTGADMAQFWKTYDVSSFSEELDGITDGVRRQLKKWRSPPLEQAQAEYRSPAKWFTIQGLESALRVVVSDYEDARDGKVPEERLRLWENYMNQCVSLIRTLKMEEAQLAAVASGKVPGGANVSPIQNPAAGAAPGGGPPGGGPA